MTVQALQRLIQIGEGLHIEFKKKIPEPERIAKEIIALANTKGGKILVGIEDDGTVCGVRDADEETFALKQAMVRHISPEVEHDIEVVPVSRKKDVLVLSIPNSHKKPHFLISKDGMRKIAFVRLEDKSIEASKEMVRIMRDEQNPRDVQFEFGEKERKLMAYLDRYEKITVSQFARLADIPPKQAAHTLVLLVRANILMLKPQEDEDLYLVA
ncbi:MAG TPA: ATP-binding protein [Rhodothermales bacterium]|nr:ATP-binding protein [Rhodothermales bacterium]HRR09938.1 ATP-binding protein [Rhodothermales bacterium]